MQAKTFLVTGATGFIGGALVKRLLEHGHTVRRAVRDSPKEPNDIQIDLPASISDWETAISGVDGVFHLAWSTVPGTADREPLADVTTNVAGAVCLLEALRRRAHIPLVLTSSGGTVYGAPEFTPIPETHPLKPIGIYGASKMAVENYALVYRRQFGVDARIMRLSNPFGPGQDVNGQLGAATVFAWKAITGQEISIWGDGSVVRDFIYIEDTVNALLSLMNASPEVFISSGPIVNIGSGRGVSLKHIVTTIENALNRKIPVKYEFARTFDVPVNVLDISLAWHALQWRPETTFEEGMNHLLRAFADKAVARIEPGSVR